MKCMLQRQTLIKYCWRGGKAIYKTVWIVWSHFAKEKYAYIYMSKKTRRLCTKMLIRSSSRERPACGSYLILLASPHLLYFLR